LLYEFHSTYTAYLQLQQTLGAGSTLAILLLLSRCCGLTQETQRLHVGGDHMHLEHGDDLKRLPQQQSHTPTDIC
jgi:hypothetical protein